MTRIDRRGLLTSWLALASAILTLGRGDAEGRQRPAVRRARRRVRRRVRRRIRRRVVSRVVLGRRLWVVPVGLAVGWELAMGPRIVVVKETKVVVRDGTKVEVAVVQGDDGKAEEIEVTREDTDDNRKNLQGSMLDDSDKTTPAVEGDEDVEVDN